MPSAVHWITNSDALDPVRVKKKKGQTLSQTKVRLWGFFSITEHMSFELRCSMGFWGE